MIELTPDITDVDVVSHGVLRLTFADGLSGTVRVLDRMRGPVFEEARSPAGFAQVKVDGETGTVVWPAGADLAPDTLYERVRTGSWPNDDTAASVPTPEELRSRLSRRTPVESPESPAEAIRRHRDA